MNKTLLKSFILAILFLCVPYFGSAYEREDLASAIIQVPGDYNSIQEAINAASPGGMIRIGAGVYYEHIIVNKSLTLVGEGEKTIIDGENQYLTIVRITANNSKLSGFRLQNTGWQWGVCGVEVYNVGSCEISNNSIFLTCHQIRVVNSENVEIFNNSISAPSTLHPQSAYGIRLENSTNCIVKDNEISNHIGGIHLQNATDCKVVANRIFQNGQGIRLYTPCTRNEIIANTVYNNTYDGMIEAMPGNATLRGNIFLHNNFINNSFPFTYKVTGCIWDNGVEGNYWTRYNGSDYNNDGIGDVAYNVGLEYDNHPLMGYFSFFKATTTHDINIITNSTIISFSYFHYNSTIKFLVSNSTRSQESGFCRVQIPHTLMFESYNISVDGATPKTWNYDLYDDGENRWIYFTYNHTIHKIIIIPENPTLILASILLITTLLIVGFHRRREHTNL